MGLFPKTGLCIAAGLQLAAMQSAQAQATLFVCDPTIAQNAAERHARRIELARLGGDAIDIPALEAAMKNAVVQHSQPNR